MWSYSENEGVISKKAYLPGAHLPHPRPYISSTATRRAQFAASQVTFGSAITGLTWVGVVARMDVDKLVHLCRVAKTRIN